MDLGFRMVRLWLFSQTRLGPGPRQPGWQVQGVGSLVCTSERGPRRMLLSAGVGSAEDCGKPLVRARSGEPLPCLYLNVKDMNSRITPLSLNRAVAFVLRFLSGREPGGVQRQSLKLPYAGWLPHERVSSQACLGLSAGVGEELLPEGLSRITTTGRPVSHRIRWDSSTQVVI